MAFTTPQAQSACFTSRKGPKRLSKSKRHQLKTELPPLKAALWIAKIPVLKQGAINAFKLAAPEIHKNHAVIKESHSQEKKSAAFILTACILIPLICFLSLTTLRLFNEGNGFECILCALATLIPLSLFLNLIRVNAEWSTNARYSFGHIRNNRSPDGYRNLNWRLHFIGNHDDDVRHIPAGMPDAVRSIVHRINQLKLPDGCELYVDCYGICGMLNIQTTEESYYLAAWPSVD